MGVDDVDETAIMAVDNVEALDSTMNETADLEYEMEMYCQADDGGGFSPHEINWKPLFIQETPLATILTLAEAAITTEYGIKNTSRD